MNNEAGSDLERQGSASSAFWWRLCDNAFRRALWLLVPVALLAALGVWQAGNTLELYRSGGLLSASSNPLIPEQQIGGVAQANFWETPATASSRTINEQLRTDLFVEDVAERSGLTPMIEAGTLDIAVVRGAIWSTADGTSLVNVNAVWGDPQTAFGLVDGTILAYQEFLASSVASQSSEAETFYKEQLEEYQGEIDTAQLALEKFLDDFGAIPADERPITVELELTRLTNTLDNAESNASNAQAQIDAAELAVTQSRSEAGRSLTVIDAPKVPINPQSTLVKRASILISFTLLGVVIMLAALVIGTVLDQSIVSAPDIRGIRGVEHVATVPEVRLEPLSRESSRPVRSRRTTSSRADRAEQVSV